MSHRPILSLKKKERASDISSDELKSFRVKAQLELEKRQRAERIRVRREIIAYVLEQVTDYKIPVARGLATTLRQILAADSSFSTRKIGIGIHAWVTSDAYLESLIHGTHRFNLDGSVSELISSEDKLYAQSLLDARTSRKK